MIKPSLTLVLIGLMLTGCASSRSSGLYSWGDYEADLYQYYHQPDKKEQIVADHLEFLARVESAGKKPAPGLYAEAGTFLLAQGERARAIEYYQKEHDAWPESQPLMATLIKNLQEQ